MAYFDSHFSKYKLYFPSPGSNIFFDYDLSHHIVMKMNKNISFDFLVTEPKLAALKLSNAWYGKLVW